MFKEWENSAYVSPWADLPKELLSIIVKNFLESPIEITLFRSVCSSWRSSTPPFKTTFPVSALPYKKFCYPKERYPTLKIVYCIDPLVQSSSTPNSWLIAVEFDGCRIYFVNPFTGLRVESLHSLLPKQLNLCDFRFTELKTTYNVQDLIVFSNEVKQCIEEKALLVSPPYYDQEMLLVLNFGYLVFYKFSIDGWIVLTEIEKETFDDIILYHGRVWAISSCGKIVVFYSDLNPKEITHHVIPKAISCKWYLIESCGRIYLIAKYLNDQNPNFILSYFSNVISQWLSLMNDGVLQIRVYKLLMLEEENLLEEVSHIDDMVVFISIHTHWSFSALPKDFFGCKGNCIVFSGHGGIIDGTSYELPTNAGIFDIQTGNLRVLDECSSYGEMYWPPPNWLNPQNIA